MKMTSGQCPAVARQVMPTTLAYQTHIGGMEDKLSKQVVSTRLSYELNFICLRLALAQMLLSPSLDSQKLHTSATVAKVKL